MYNFRFQQAFYQVRLQKWPYSTPIIIRESGVVEGKSEGFILDKWCYIGSVKEDGQDKNMELSKELEFDLDTYKILKSFLKTKKGVRISPINLQQMQLF